MRQTSVKVKLLVVQKNVSQLIHLDVSHQGSLKMNYKNLTILVIGLLTGCSSLFGKEIQVEDFVTRHLKVVSRNINLTPEFYEKIVDNCKAVHTGRP